MKKILIIITLSMTGFLSFGQVRLFSEEVEDFSRDKGFGPNQKHYVQFLFTYGSYFGKSNPGAVVNPFVSTYFSLNLRYKLKLSRNFALGSELEFPFSSFHLSQEQGKIFPDTILHLNERIEVNEIRGSLYFRVNFNKRRGEYLGTFADVGMKSGWIYAFYHHTLDKTNGIKVHTTYNGYDFYKPLINYWYIRLGFDKVSFILMKRFSSFFKPSVAYPDLIKYSAGIEYSF
ncbi:MAG: hypothetical protein GX437_10005 [Sphingobacteriales bacterium]|nr:hypothetical protein [Sphingobacteriales bacterium]